MFPFNFGNSASGGVSASGGILGTPATVGIYQAPEVFPKHTKYIRDDVGKELTPDQQQLFIDSFPVGNLLGTWKSLEEVTKDAKAYMKGFERKDIGSEWVLDQLSEMVIEGLVKSETRSHWDT